MAEKLQCSTRHMYNFMNHGLKSFKIGLSPDPALRARGVHREAGKAR
ncbi:hypothetical protein ACXYTP_12060 [Tsukamurella ocularis]